MGLKSYIDQIEGFLYSLGYEKEIIEIDQILFRPRPYQRIMGGDVILTIHPLFIRVKGPKGLVHIIFKTVEVIGIE